MQQREMPFQTSDDFGNVLKASLQEPAEDHLEAALIRSGDSVIVKEAAPFAGTGNWVEPR